MEPIEIVIDDPRPGPASGSSAACSRRSCDTANCATSSSACARRTPMTDEAHRPALRRPGDGPEVRRAPPARALVQQAPTESAPARPARRAQARRPHPPSRRLHRVDANSVPPRTSSTSMPDDWRKIERGLFESPDGQWRIANPWRAEDRVASPLARRPAPLQRIGLVHARRRPRHAARRPRLRRWPHRS